MSTQKHRSPSNPSRIPRRMRLSGNPAIDNSDSDITMLQIVVCSGRTESC